MLYSAKTLREYRIRAVDDEVGSIRDFYFEDTNWMVRYIVADTGSWLTGREILLSPYAAEQPDERNGFLPVTLTRRQIEESPDIETDKPLSRQHEHALHAYYGWPIYWGNPGIIPGFIPMPPLDLEPPAEERHHNPHLRSAKEIEGYRIHARDGEIGHISDTILDTMPWRIRYVSVNTGNWFPGKKVLFAADWIGKISLTEREVMFDVSRDEIRRSPEYNPDEPLTRAYEERLYDYYHRPGYWHEEYQQAR